MQNNELAVIFTPKTDLWLEFMYELVNHSTENYSTIKQK